MNDSITTTVLNTDSAALDELHTVLRNKDFKITHEFLLSAASTIDSWLEKYSRFRVYLYAKLESAEHHGPVEHTLCEKLITTVGEIRDTARDLTRKMRGHSTLKTSAYESLLKNMPKDPAGSALYAEYKDHVLNVQSSDEDLLYIDELSGTIEALQELISYLSGTLVVNKKTFEKLHKLEDISRVNYS